MQNIQEKKIVINNVLRIHQLTNVNLEKELRHLINPFAFQKAFLNKQKDK